MRTAEARQILNVRRQRQRSQCNQATQASETSSIQVRQRCARELKRHGDLARYTV